MKTLRRVALLGVLTTVVVTGVVLLQNRQDRAQVRQVEASSKTAAKSVRQAATDAVTAGRQFVRVAGEIKTNVADVTQKGLHKAGEIFTNVARRAREAASNVVNAVANTTTNVVDQARHDFQRAPN